MRFARVLPACLAAFFCLVAIPAAGAPSPAAGVDPVLRARLAHELERLDRE